MVGLKMSGIDHNLCCSMTFYDSQKVRHVGDMDKKTTGSVSKPCTPGEHQNSW